MGQRTPSRFADAPEVAGSPPDCSTARRTTALPGSHCRPTSHLHSRRTLSLSATHHLRALPLSLGQQIAAARRRKRRFKPRFFQPGEPCRRPGRGSRRGVVSMGLSGPSAVGVLASLRSSNWVLLHPQARRRSRPRRHTAAPVLHHWIVAWRLDSEPYLKSTGYTRGHGGQRSKVIRPKGHGNRSEEQVTRPLAIRQHERKTWCHEVRRDRRTLKASFFIDSAQQHGFVQAREHWFLGGICRSPQSLKQVVTEIDLASMLTGLHTLLSLDRRALSNGLALGVKPFAPPRAARQPSSSRFGHWRHPVRRRVLFTGGVRSNCGGRRARPGCSLTRCCGW